MNRGPKSKFFNKNKKIQKIVNDIDKYSVEDLGKLKLSKWIRDTLVDVKLGKTVVTAEDIVTILNNQPVASEEHTYALYKFTSATQFINDVEIFINELVVVIDSTTAKINQIEIPLSKMINHLTFIKKIDSIQDYWELKNNSDWMKHYPGTSKITDLVDNAKVKNVGGVNITIK